MTKSHLVPKHIVDKNGKQTTVFVNPDRDNQHSLSQSSKDPNDFTQGRLSSTEDIDPEDIFPDTFFEDFDLSDDDDYKSTSKAIIAAATREYVELTNAYGNPMKTKNVCHWATDDTGKTTISMALSQKGIDKLNDDVSNSENGASPHEVTRFSLSGDNEDDASGLCVKTRLMTMTVNSYGDQEWRNPEGQLHSVGDRPALIGYDGTEYWFKNGKKHREGGKPANYGEGGKRLQYWENDVLHRDGGLPAIIHNDGRKEHWVRGVRQFSDHD